MAGISGQLYLFNEYYGPTRGVAGHHFYTAFPERETNMNEFNLNIPDAWALYSSQNPDSAAGTLTPVYRLYKIGAGHFYTISTAERTSAQNQGYLYEGVVGYAYSSPGNFRIPVYRYYSPSQNNHWYPTGTAGFVGYIYEQIAWYSPIRVFGCKDPAATNYNRNVNQSSSGCTYAAPTATITVNPASITVGESSTLSWSVSNATSISITGIGTVSSSGSRTVSPSSTTTYTLTATGAGGTTTRSATVTVIIPAPTITFSVSPESICLNGTATLSWSVSGSVTSISIDQGIGTVSSSGSRTVSPSSPRTYTLTAEGPGGTTSKLASLGIKYPTTTTISADSTNIISGQSTILRWATSGDATSASITPGIGSVNINGNRTISPTETTTYQINVTGVCTNSSNSVTVNVYQPPTVQFSGPEFILYGEQGTLSYEATNSDLKLEVIPTYNYRNGSILGNTISLPTGNLSIGTIQTQIPYNEQGPTSIYYIIVAMGRGGQDSKQITIPIVIDETPDNFLVPESDDLLLSQDPVITPNENLTSYEIVVQDIDVPVEVKADKPILVEVNDDDIWNKIRKIQ